MDPHRGLSLRGDATNALPLLEPEPEHEPEPAKYGTCKIVYPVCEGYNCYRQLCGMPKAATFDDLVELPAHVIEKFRQLYESVFMFYIRPFLTFCTSSPQTS